MMHLPIKFQWLNQAHFQINNHHIFPPDNTYLILIELFYNIDVVFFSHRHILYFSNPWSFLDPAEIAWQAVFQPELIEKGRKI